MWKMVITWFSAVCLLLACEQAVADAACVWVLWKERVEGRDITSPEQPWFLVNTFPDKEACVQGLKTSVEALKSETKELTAANPASMVDALVHDESGGVTHFGTDNPILRPNFSVRFLCLPDTLDPHKVTHP